MMTTQPYSRDNQNYSKILMKAFLQVSQEEELLREIQRSLPNVYEYGYSKLRYDSISVRNFIQ